MNIRLKILRDSLSKKTKNHPKVSKRRVGRRPNHQKMGNHHIFTIVIQGDLLNFDSGYVFIALNNEIILHYLFDVINMHQF